MVHATDLGLARVIGEGIAISDEWRRLEGGPLNLLASPVLRKKYPLRYEKDDFGVFAKGKVGLG